MNIEKRMLQWTDETDSTNWRREGFDFSKDFNGDVYEKNGLDLPEDNTNLL